jgi:hypothetical protein
MAEYIDMTEGLVPVPRPDFHFYVHNAFEWRTGTELHTLMKAFDKEKHTYWVWYVPLKVRPGTTPYAINCYRPQVTGAFVLDVIEYKNRKLVVKE